MTGGESEGAQEARAAAEGWAGTAGMERQGDKTRRGAGHEVGRAAVLPTPSD